MTAPALGLARDSVDIVDYDARWPALFIEERDRLLTALAPAVTRIEHIGSTAVPGLPAKPILDMMAAVPALPAPPAICRALRGLGYEDRGEAGVPGRIVFVLGPYVCRTHYLHVCVGDGTHWREKLAFRDHMRAHREDAARYAALKRRLASGHPTDRDRYTDAKSAFVADILAGPRHRRGRGVSPGARAVDGRVSPGARAVGGLE
jgi:GrpB-like predicted nucleotidyltransferase (UPF0157 family)